MKKANVYSRLLFEQLIAGGTHMVAKVVVPDIDAATPTFFLTFIATTALQFLSRL